MPRPPGVWMLWGSSVPLFKGTGQSIRGDCGRHTLTLCLFMIYNAIPSVLPRLLAQPLAGISPSILHLILPYMASSLWILDCWVSLSPVLSPLMELCSGRGEEGDHRGPLGRRSTKDRYRLGPPFGDCPIFLTAASEGRTYTPGGI